MVGFYCSQLRLVVELDSAAHETPREPEHDRERDEWLEARGYRVLPFRNEQVLKWLEGVLAAIGQAVAATDVAPEESCNFVREEG